MEPTVIERSFKPRSTGHETFACRFTWLPKAAQLIQRDPLALSSDDVAIVELGLGKNMVRSLRFWLDAFDLASPSGGAWSLHPFGEAIFGTNGLDPFIERLETQWLLQWSLVSRQDSQLLAWRHLFFRRMRPDFTRGELMADLRREAEGLALQLSEVTLQQHVDVMLHTYVGGSATTAPEDVFDGPLVDLHLLRHEGRRRANGLRTEPVYVVERVALERVGSKVLDYAIERYWSDWHPHEKVVAFRDLAYGEGSPGATFRIEEEELRQYLEHGSAYAFQPSGDSGALLRTQDLEPVALLREVYA